MTTVEDVSLMIYRATSCKMRKNLKAVLVLVGLTFLLSSIQLWATATGKENTKLIFDWLQQSNIVIPVVSAQQEMQKASVLHQQKTTPPYIERIVESNIETVFTEEEVGMAQKSFEALTATNKVTAVMLNWRRPGNVAMIASELQKYPFIDELIIWNNNNDTVLAAENYGSKVKVVNSVYNLKTR